MLDELLAGLWTNVHGIDHTSIRLFESDTLTTESTILIKNGLFTWCGVIVEKASAVLEESSFGPFRGRMLELPAVVLSDARGFSYFLATLDEVDDVITKVISSVSSEFKARRLLMELHSVLLDRSPFLWRTLSPLLRALLDAESMSVDTVRFLRQLSNLLSKIHIERPDLLADSFESYLYEEELSVAETLVQTSRDPIYWELILGIRSALAEVISSFKMEEPKPIHGPGAVANPKVKSSLGKYLDIGYDNRIDYMLKKSTGERMSDYSPFDLVEGARTSRVVFVPKSWKKLRGISAEPTGLQYFQQAVLSSLMSCVYKTSLGQFINLNDQTLSRDMALRGSRDGSLATIDLSSASDSVTLRLVKDVFGSSHLCRWLLATRSTHTLLGEQRLEISKFAPMGSACCFPVECLIFLGIVLACAARTSKRFRANARNVRVYGDDIICPAFLAEDVIDDLERLGFSVNSEKSYHSGDYRESCGMDAWRGFDVTPLKLKDFSFDLDGTKPLSYEHRSRTVSYINTLYFGGYHRLRSFLLRKLMNGKIVLKGQGFGVDRSLYFGSGQRGTVFSPRPDNFHLQRVTLKGVQRSGVRLLDWSPRYDSLTAREELLLDEVKYFEFLLLSRGKDSAQVVTYDPKRAHHVDVLTEIARAFKYQDGKPESVRALGMRMVPSYSVHDKWYE